MFFPLLYRVLYENGKALLESSAVNVIFMRLILSAFSLPKRETWILFLYRLLRSPYYRFNKIAFQLLTRVIYMYAYSLPYTYMYTLRIIFLTLAVFSLCFNRISAKYLWIWPPRRKRRQRWMTPVRFIIFYPGGVV